MNYTKFFLSTAAGALLFVGVTNAAEHEVIQKNKAFSVEELTIKAGDTVKFTNQDSFFHNVFSLSDLKTFDLGSYPKGEFKSITFDKSGEVEVECAIHPSMLITINVK